VLGVQVEEVGALEIDEEPDSVSGLEDHVRWQPGDERRGRPPEHGWRVAVSTEARADVGGVGELHAGAFGVEGDELMRAEPLDARHRELER
jgi:hypothetical protein